MSLPPLNFTGGAATSGDAGNGSQWGGAGGGDWNVNVGGPAPSLQGATSMGALIPILIVAAVAWFLLQKR